jgi:hypothetical protein
MFPPLSAIVSKNLLSTPSNIKPHIPSVFFSEHFLPPEFPLRIANCYSAREKRKNVDLAKSVYHKTLPTPETAKVRVSPNL